MRARLRATAGGGWCTVEGVAACWVVHGGGWMHAAGPVSLQPPARWRAEVARWRAEGVAACWVVHGGGGGWMHPAGPVSLHAFLGG